MVALIGIEVVEKVTLVMNARFVISMFAAHTQRLMLAAEVFKIFVIQ